MSAQTFCQELFKTWWEFDCTGFDGADIQELGIKHGLLEMVPYDPEKHGESDWGHKPGDDWLQLTNEGKK